MFCRYFQAYVVPERVWLLTAILRGCDHVAFDRTLDVQKSIFEFFVPADCLETFVALMDIFQKKGIVTNLAELPNRLL